MAQIVFYPGNTNLVRLRGLRNVQLDSYLTGTATVQITLRYPDGGTNLTGETWPVTLDYEASSNGNFSGVVASALAIVAKHEYEMLVEVTDSGSDGEWTTPVFAKVRRE